MKDQVRITKAKRTFLVTAIALILLMLPQQVSAHCDSYDGPVIKDALTALENQNIAPVLKWVEPQFEEEISSLFQKTLKYKKEDKEVYELLEKHFLETLVRIHREGEGAPYNGLKPAGSTKPIIGMTDAALEDEEIEPLISALNGHISKVVKEKYSKVAQLKKYKDTSPKAGREYVAAYVDYTHTVEALHDVLEHSNDLHSH